MKTDILSNLVVKEVLFAATMFSEKGAHGKRTKREHWAIHLKYEGETVYSNNSEKFICNKDNVIVLPKGCSYEWRCEKDGHFMAIEFECDCDCDTIFSFHIKESDDIYKLFRELEKQRMLKSPAFQLEGFRCVYTLLVKLLSSYEKKYIPKTKMHKIIPALEYITQNLDKNIQNDTLAAECNISTVYMRKLFTECFGVPPKTYIHRLRIKKAKEMLKSDYGSITNIAESLGYANVYDFSRVFKKITGVPPTKY